MDPVFLTDTTRDGNVITLRHLEMEDLDLCLKWINDPEIREFVLETLPTTRYHERKWLQDLCEHRGPVGNPTDLVFAIETEGHVIGTVGIHSISMVHRHATTGMMIGQKEWREIGIGSVVKQLVIRYCFTELNLERLQTAVLSDNKRSIKLQERAGFKLVGTIPCWFFKNGRYQDDLIYHLEREDWLKVKPR